jgi:hypothetical protein
VIGFIEWFAGCYLLSNFVTNGHQGGDLGWAAFWLGMGAADFVSTKLKETRGPRDGK